MALIAFLLVAAAFACFLLLNSATSTTTSAQTPTYTKYKAVDTGQTYTCSIKEAKDAQGNPTTDDGKIDCWGHTGTGFTAPPDDGGFVQLSVERRHACGIKSDGTTKCWGYAIPGDLNSDNYFDTDNIKYSSIDIGHDHACGIVLQDSSTTDRKNPGEMICKYGINANLNDNPVDIHLQAVVPNGYTFQSVTAGRNHTCGLVLDSNSANNTPDEGKDTVRCWGNPSESPDGTFKSIVAGHSYTCGVKTDDTIECWGATPGNQPDFSKHKFKSVAGGNAFACGIVLDSDTDTTPNEDEGELICWGSDYTEQSTPPLGTYKSIESTTTHSCAIAIDSDPDTAGNQGEGNMVCWGQNQTSGRLWPTQAPSSPLQPTPVWPPPMPIPSDPPRDSLIQFSTGVRYSCALTGAGQAECFGTDSFNLGIASPPTIRFDSLAAGLVTHVCGITHYDRTAFCWGNTSVAQYGMAEPPKDVSFKKIDSGFYASCGIVLDGNIATLGTNEHEDSLICWGINNGTSNDFGQVSDAPGKYDQVTVSFSTGKFSDVSIGGTWSGGNTEHACAVRLGDDPGTNDVTETRGTVKCWGNNSHGQTTVPANMTFKSVDANARNTCGIILDSDTTNTTPNDDEDKVKCWGKDVAEDPVSRKKILENFFFSGDDIATFKSISVAQQFACGIVLDSDLDSASNQNEGTVKCKSNKETKHKKYIGPSYGCSIQDLTCDNEAVLTRYTSLDVGDFYVCAITTDSKLDCYGSTTWKNISAPLANPPGYPNQPPGPVPDPVTFPTDPADADLPSCSQYPDHSVVTPLEGGRYPTSGGNFYVIVSHAAIPNETSLLIHMSEADRGSGGPGGVEVEIEPKRYDATVVDDECNEVTSQNLTRPADVCVPMPPGATHLNARMFQIVSNNGSDEYGVTSSFADADGKLCVEVEKLPITLAAGKVFTTQELTVTAVAQMTATAAAEATATAIAKMTATATHTPTPTPTPTPIAVPVIFRIAPTISSVILPAGEKVRLGVDVYGMQNIRDNRLADKHKITFEWSSSPPAGSFAEANREADADSKVDDREVIYTVPQEPGTYTLKAFVDRMVCGDDDGLDDGCFAEIQITVRRPFAVVSPTTTPSNPDGEIPSIITDSDGNLYEVFTPEEGGNFDGNDATVSADPGAVPNGEIIGMRADADGTASNVGQVLDRVTLDGNYYTISAVDATGQPLSGYLLDDPIEVCIPVPPRLKSNISDVAMVSVRDDGTFAVLSSRLRLGDAGVTMCAALSTLSARVAAAHTGSPSALPSPTPLPTPIDPDTGGTTMPTSAIILLMMLGAALGLMSVMLMARRR